MEVAVLKAKAQLQGVSGARVLDGGGGGEARRERARVMATPSPRTPPAPTTIDDYWLNASLLWNATHLNATFGLNSTRLDDYWFCAKWASAQEDFFQAANLCFAIAFLVPKSFKQSILILRALVVAGCGMMAIWAGTEFCAPDVFAWTLLQILVNSIHTVLLIIRFLPPALSLELTDLYLKLFKPLKVSKKHFKELTKEARVVRLEVGEAYAVEEVTPADEQLSILIKGKLRVTCAETLLHHILPYQFVDSPEWEANREQSDDVFQVTVLAEEVSTYVCWPRMRLERVLRHRPMVKTVLDCLIGKDITHKLYTLNEGLGAHGTMPVGVVEASPATLARSASVDAVHEGARGRLRSDNWTNFSRPPSNRSNSYWKPLSARQFPKHSPFPLKQSPLLTPPSVPRLLPQMSSSSLQTPKRQPSMLRRATSFRKAREVKFADPGPSFPGDETV